MSISHWGVFPGWFIASWAIGSTVPDWQPVSFDAWCTAKYTYGSTGQ